MSSLRVPDRRKNTAFSGLALPLVLSALTFASVCGCDNKPPPRPAKPGMVFSARDEVGKPITLRVDSVEKDPMDTEGDVVLYTVSVRRSYFDTWKPYCSPDKDEKRYAIPLSGSWNERGEHSDDGTLTFACSVGALGKCARFGYKPWKKLENASMRDLHQACTRMVRADYCGNGVSHTGAVRLPIAITQRF